ncbi:spore germination protein GerPE [Aquibacillus sp. 3ASR75-11]|uniref:Spore germination protein GerPE n=1 Tax=Terrihalobacillus insolitus TaxID=2950438 RepID=A0A9X4AN92_9BACI|nr:spore germination protein GerPE [Terrihalobacillus insolitus]MDC3413730.1 spore germination protein GerPE [Terrihalobacillus insolitus]MDC3425589.1 spore germination protein GerPE [Terrihalobacillus insolitus]
MHKRTANVNRIKVIAASNSAIVGIGDVTYSSPVSNIIAVQKEGNVFINEENKYDFNKYPVFSRSPAEHHDHPIRVQEDTTHHVPAIGVNKVDVYGVASSSIFQVGSLGHIDAEARLKHIRILKDEQK